jgi:hypothetical protein
VIKYNRIRRFSPIKPTVNIAKNSFVLKDLDVYSALSVSFKRLVPDIFTVRIRKVLTRHHVHGLFKECTWFFKARFLLLTNKEWAPPDFR